MYAQRAVKIGKRIKALRKENHLTQDQLAAKIDSIVPPINEKGLGQSTISGWEKGSQLPPLPKLIALSEIFQCDIAYLLCDYDKKKKDVSDIAELTGLSEKSVDNLLYLKTLSKIKKLFVLENVFCMSASEEETPAWVINYFLEDEKILHLLYLFFVTECMDKSGIVEHARSNSILIELIGILTSKRDYLEKQIRSKNEVVDNG